MYDKANITDEAITTPNGKFDQEYLKSKPAITKPNMKTIEDNSITCFWVDSVSFIFNLLVSNSLSLKNNTNPKINIGINNRAINNQAFPKLKVPAGMNSNNPTKINPKIYLVIASNKSFKFLFIYINPFKIILTKIISNKFFRVNSQKTIQNDNKIFTKEKI